MIERLVFSKRLRAAHDDKAGVLRARHNDLGEHGGTDICTVLGDGIPVQFAADPYDQGRYYQRDNDNP